jgi:hypothetical protein
MASINARVSLKTRIQSMSKAFAAALLFVILAQPVGAAESSSPPSAQTATMPKQSTGDDQRINLGLTPQEKTQFLADMRNMLASIQGVMQGIGKADRSKIAESARMSGNRMARATPASTRAKLPQSFRDIGGPTHMQFEELAVDAETYDMDMLASKAGEIMDQCMTCHAAFRAN